MRFDAVYYEPDSLHYPLGKQLKEQYGDLPWFPIENHNRIEEMQQQPNSQVRAVEAAPGRGGCARRINMWKISKFPLSVL